MTGIDKYIKPELLILIPVLFFIGEALKASNISNKWIPYILGACGIVLCAVYVMATNSFTDVKSVSEGVFTAIVQGILIAGTSTWANEAIKQVRK